MVKGERKGTLAKLQTRVVLLRGINVGGRRKVPMAELKELAVGLGVESPQTYIASGNLIGDSSESPQALETAFESVLSDHFGFEVPVIVRTAERWWELAEGSAFPDAEAERPKLLHVGLSKAMPQAGATELLEEKAGDGERIALLADGLWIDYAEGVARSKLTPAVLDRAVGSTVTCRNWLTVQKLASLLRER